LAGTIKVDQIETPYLYLGDDDPDSAAIHSKYLPTHVPQAELPSSACAPGPYTMPVADLQHALGLLETDGELMVPRPRWADEFGLQRQELYSGEANVAFLSRGLPDGWQVFMSRSEPCEPFYYHRESNVTQWERPVVPSLLATAIPAQAAAAVDISDGPPVTLVKGAFVKLPLRKRVELTHNTRKFRFALPTDKHTLGLPVGQHLFIKLTSAAGETAMRAYTPLLDPHPEGCGEGYVDFVIKVYFANGHPLFPDGGKLTQLLEKLRIGDTIEVKGPSPRVSG